MSARTNRSIAGHNPDRYKNRSRHGITPARLTEQNRSIVGVYPHRYKQDTLLYRGIIKPFYLFLCIHLFPLIVHLDTIGSKAFIVILHPQSPQNGM
ncbi:unnamed protein product [Linum tenue]|uniref:Uncharacterized protein n=1 Tax=Linum tenue TaxID=586396 RepID=A0AAV0MJL8_9ROSI|nr:unnamed protein product [Linum tenue]